MLTFVNEELFSYATKHEINSQTKKDILQLSVSTSNFLVTYAKGSKMDKYHNPQQDQKINKNHDIDMRDNPNIIPINREILSVNYISDAQAETPSLLMEQPTSLKVTDNARGIPQVTVRCLKDNSDNKSDIYVVAFPFNGMIQPIPEDPRYRIYKGMIMSSVRPFYFKGRRYRKILYLVVEPHRALFNVNHKYHTDTIELKLESYAIYKDKDTGEEKTNHETFHLNMMQNSFDYGWEYEIMDEAFRIDAIPDKPLWVTFKFNQKDFDKNKNSHQNSDNPFNGRTPNPTKKKNGQKNGYVEGNTYVTTNKNGIRKEVPIRSNNSGYRKNEKKDLDSMMQESGMFDDEKFDRSNRYDRKKKGKKGGKRGRNQYDDYGY